MAQRFRVGLPTIPPNTLIGNNATTPNGEPPFALTGAEVAELISANSVISVANSFSFDHTIHNQLMLISTSNTAINATLTKNANIGSTFSLTQKGSGQITFVAETGAAIHNDQSNFKTYGQWSVASAFVEGNVDGNTASWVVSGSLTT